MSGPLPTCTSFIIPPPSDSPRLMAGGGQQGRHERGKNLRRVYQSPPLHVIAGNQIHKGSMSLIVPHRDRHRPREKTNSTLGVGSIDCDDLSVSCRPSSYPKCHISHL